MNKITYNDWLLDVTARVGYDTPAQIETEAGDGPREAYKGGMTPKQYANHFLHQDMLYRLENKLPLR